MMTPMSGMTRLQATPPADGRPTARSAWVDAAKGLCIILVVMMHTALGVGEAMGGEGWLHAVVAFAKPFRIPAFFLLAGLFLARTIAQPWATFLDRKLLHFVYFYLLWAGIQISLKIGAAHGASAALTAMAQALIEPYGTLWFIYLLPIFFVVTKMLRPIPAPLILAAAVLLEMLLVQTGWTAIDEFSARYIWFFAGYALAQIVFQAAGWMRMHSALTAVSALAAGVVTALCVVYGIADSRGVSLLLGISGSLGLIAVAVLLTHTVAGGALQYIGRNSIVIYLAFFLPMVVMRMILLRTGLAPVLGIGLTSLLVWITAVLIPLVLQKLVAGTVLQFLFVRPAWAQASRKLLPTLKAAE
ncbi:MAG: acyltransferase family protein [Beijerinckiaceae bacterium]